MEKINVGGQAVIEGVMMRAPRAIGIAVRRPSGEVVVKLEKWIPLSERFSILKRPIFRGIAGMGESLYLGVKALNFSANEAMVEEEGEEKKEGGDKK